MNTATTAVVRKITRTLFAIQSLGQAAMVAVSPIMAIAGSKLSGQPAWAGVPSMCYQIGQALAAFGWGYAMDPLGRRGMLTLGMALGAAGGSLSALAIVSRTFSTFLWVPP